MNRTMRTLLSLSLAIIMICCSLNMTSKAEAEGTGDNTINVLILFDESYVDIMRRKGGASSALQLSDRLLEMTKFLKVPYMKTLGLNLEFSVMTYESLFKSSYASANGNGCLWSWGSDKLLGKVKVWKTGYNDFCNEDCPHDDGNDDIIDNGCYASLDIPGHASSGVRYLDIMKNYLKSDKGAEFDLMALYVGHNFCSVYGNRHSHWGGLSTVGGNTLIMRGCDNLSGGSDAILIEQLDNMVSMMDCFRHEFSHSLGITEGLTHSANQPCSLIGGFGNIFYVENAWCSECIKRMNYNHLL